MEREREREIDGQISGEQWNLNVDEFMDGRRILQLKRKFSFLIRFVCLCSCVDPNEIQLMSTSSALRSLYYIYTYILYILASAMPAHFRKIMCEWEHTHTHRMADHLQQKQPSGKYKMQSE